MVKTTLFLGILLINIGTLFAQIDASLLLGLKQATTTEIGNISSPIEGSLIYNSTTKLVMQYNGSSWEEIGGNAGNVYTTDGTLSNSRTLALETNNLAINSTGGDVTIDSNTLVVDASENRVGIGTTTPSAALDVNGKTRLRDIPTGTNTDQLLTTDTNGNIKKIEQPLPNKSYVQVYKGSKTFGSGNATLLNLFPEVTIQPNKKVLLHVYVPTRSTTNSWGGLYVNINAKVNGTWYNLGNTGYDGGAMSYGSTDIHALNHELLLDFITNLNLPANAPYTLQFELTARSYNGSTYVNLSHDINRTVNNLGSRGALQKWASDQNYCHLIIIEKDQ